MLALCLKITTKFNCLLQRLLTSFIQKLFTPKSFEGDFTLVASLDGSTKKISMPDSIRYVLSFRMSQLSITTSQLQVPVQ